jgi:hypothetical protein
MGRNAVSLYDKTDPRAAARMETHRRAMGLPIDTRPRCYFCAQLPDFCLCGGGVAAIEETAQCPTT